MRKSVFAKPRCLTSLSNRILSLGIKLLTRDYSEVQKGKDICDRICGVAKDRMRSWVATGNNLLNAHDIKEGMEHRGGVKNT